MKVIFKKGKTVVGLDGNGLVTLKQEHVLNPGHLDYVILSKEEVIQIANTFRKKSIPVLHRHSPR